MKRRLEAGGKRQGLTPSALMTPSAPNYGRQPGTPVGVRQLWAIARYTRKGAL